MSEDIIARLRDLHGFDHCDVLAAKEAAAEITRLRAELAAKDARIAQLEAGLRKVKELPRHNLTEDAWGQIQAYVRAFGEWVDADEVHHIIEEALR